MKIYTIYKTICKSNGKIYVGQHKTKEINDGYLGSGKLIRRAISKYGIDDFEKQILEVVETFEEATIKEEYYIQLYDSTNPDIGYNITKYAWGGQPHTDESKLKISRKLFGRKLSEQTKQKMSKPKAPFSDEHKKNMAESRKGKSWYHNPLTLEAKTFIPNTQPLGWIKGRPKTHFEGCNTKESNLKRSKALKGKPKSPEHRNKISKTLTGHFVSESTKEKISEAARKQWKQKKAGIDPSNFCY